MSRDRFQQCYRPAYTGYETWSTLTVLDVQGPPESKFPINTTCRGRDGTPYFVRIDREQDGDSYRYKTFVFQLAPEFDDQFPSAVTEESDGGLSITMEYTNSCSTPQKVRFMFNIKWDGRWRNRPECTYSPVDSDTIVRRVDLFESMIREHPSCNNILLVDFARPYESLRIGSPPSIAERDRDPLYAFSRWLRDLSQR